MPGRTARTTGGRAITKDLWTLAVTATTTQGLRDIAIGIAIKLEIEIEVETVSKISIRIDPDKQWKYAKRWRKLNSFAPSTIWLSTQFYWFPHGQWSVFLIIWRVKHSMRSSILVKEARLRLLKNWRIGMIGWLAYITWWLRSEDSRRSQIPGRIVSDNKILIFRSKLRICNDLFDVVWNVLFHSFACC